MSIKKPFKLGFTNLAIADSCPSLHSNNQSRL
jgi:hypothetical protein